MPLVILLGLKSLLKLADCKSISALLIKWKIPDAYFYDYFELPLRIPKLRYPIQTHKVYEELEEILGSDKTKFGGKDLKDGLQS